MPTRLTGIEVPIDSPDLDLALREAAAAALRIPLPSIVSVTPLKRSLDARKLRRKPRWVYTLEIWRTGEEADRAAAEVYTHRQLTPGFPALQEGPLRAPDGPPPVIIGAGPAGLFAALTFADQGVPCVVLDRGRPLAERHVSVRNFRRSGLLDPESNLCFGEGGAGTYSDGKLYTRKHHPLVRTVYERLVAFGATSDILLQAHPHIGTNRLYAILQGIREHLLERGSAIQFGAKVVDLELRGGEVRAVILEDGSRIEAGAVLLATGHSARDVYGMLHRRGVPMIQKPFALGARCEHPQALIDEIQLGDLRARHPEVEAAEYFLATQVGPRGLYSFCMCPGGYVIPTPTEEGHLNVNGMSNSNRGGTFANAALVVTVEPRDFYIQRPGDLDHHGVLAGLEFQRAWEHRAFLAGGETYRAPAQRMTDLAAGRSSTDLPERTSYRPGLVAGDLTSVLPKVVTDTLRVGVKDLDKKMRGYFTREAILIGVETTTSSPLRVVREEDRRSPGIDRLYPTGEGAGYSGGIVSSAIDGILTARAALAHHWPLRQVEP